MQQSRGYTGPTPSAGYQVPPQVAMRTGDLGEQYRARTLARMQFLRENGLDPSQLQPEQKRNIQYVDDSVIQRAAASRNLGEIPGETSAVAGRLGPPGLLNQITSPVIPPESNPLSQVPVVGESLGRMTSPLTSPLGAGLGVALPGVTATGIVGGTLAGTAGGALESAGVPTVSTPVGNIGLRSVGELAGSIAGPAVAPAIERRIGAGLGEAVERAGGVRPFIAAEAGGTQLPAEIPPMSWRRVLKDIAQGNESTADNAAIRQAAETEMARTGQTPEELMASGPPAAQPPVEQYPGLREDLQKALSGETKPSRIPTGPGSRGQYLGPALRRTYKAAGFTKDQIDQIAGGEFPELLPRISGAGGLAENTTELRKRLLAERGQGFFGKETQFPMQSQRLVQEFGGQPAAGGVAPPGGQPPAPPVQPPSGGEPVNLGVPPTGYGPPNQLSLMPDLPAPAQPPLKFNLLNELQGVIGSTLASKASLDMGALARQAQVLGWQNPKRWLGLVKPQFQATFSEDAAKAIMQDVKSDPWYGPIEAGPRQGLGFQNRLPGSSAGHEYEWGPGVPATERAGGFVGLNNSYVSRLVQRAPWIKGSERNYAITLNKQGAETYSEVAQNMWDSGVTDPKMYQALRDVVNHGRGYGAFNAGILGKSTSTFFSGRNLVARFQVLLDPFTQPGSLLQPSARQLAAKSLVSMVAGDTALLGFLSGVGALTGLGKVEWNPLNPGGDWVKYKVGDTRIDPWGGFSPMARLVARMGAAALTGTGIAQTQWDPKQVKDQLTTFFANKESPVVRLFTDATGLSTSLGGKPLSPSYLADLWTPFVADDVWQAVKAHGLKGAAVTPISGVGEGVQTYQQSAKQGLASIPQYTGIDPDIQHELFQQGGFNDQIAEMKKRMIQQGVPLQQLSQIPQENFIAALGRATGKDASFISTALLLNKKSEARKLLNPTWLRYVVDHEADLRDQEPRIFDQDLEEFLHRVHAGKAAGQ